MRHNKAVLISVTPCAILLLLFTVAHGQRKPTPGAERHLNAAISLLEKRQVDRAILELKAAIRLKPDNADAHNLIGLALARKGDQPR